MKIIDIEYCIKIGSKVICNLDIPDLIGKVGVVVEIFSSNYGISLANVNFTDNNKVKKEENIWFSFNNLSVIKG